MENKKRGMAPASPQVPDVEGSDNRMTIMIMRSIGQVRAFKISPKLIVFALIFLVFYFVASIYIINDYVGLRRKDRILSEKVKVLTTQEWQAD